MSLFVLNQLSSFVLAQIQHKQAQLLWTRPLLSSRGVETPARRKGPAEYSSGADGVDALRKEDGGGGGRQKLEDVQGTRHSALKLLSSLHPIAACHVIAALCTQTATVLTRVGKGRVTGWADPAQNSILCLRALDACVSILQKHWAPDVSAPVSAQNPDFHLTLGIMLVVCTCASVTQCCNHFLV
jgi:hypothetical protein